MNTHKVESIFPNDKATCEWLNSQKRGTRYTYTRYWKYFLEFTGLTGDKILDSRKCDKEYMWEKRVLEFKNWLINQKKQAESSASTASAMVRGFFAYHRLDLKFRRTEKQQLSERKRKTEDYKFSREDLKRMCDFADLPEKYVIAAGKSFGLRAGDFLRLTRGDLEPYIDRPIPISIGEYTTQKEKVKAFPFIDGDALHVIKLMIEAMDREGRTDPNERILRFSHEIQLSRVLQRVADKAGLKYGNKQVRFHCLRKFLIDRLSSHMSESKWKQIVGKAISEGAYVSSDSLREDYSRAMADTTFTQAADLEKRQQIVEVITSKLISGEPLSEEDRANMKRYRIQLRERAHKPRTVTNGGQADCPDGEHCEAYEQIPEAKLLEHLKAGWQIVHRLTNGEVIVRK